MHTYSSLMHSEFGTPIAKVIILRADNPEQMAKVMDCVHSGYPVTLYADHTTEEIKRIASLSFVQVRLGQQNIPLVKDDNVVVFH